MLNFVYGVLATWFVLGLASTSEFGELVLEAPINILGILLGVLCFPFIWFYCVFIRHTRTPVSPRVLEVQKIMADSTRLWGNLYFCYDSKARALRNKMFFFRVSDEIDNPNKPSSPPIDPDAWMKDL